MKYHIILISLFMACTHLFAQNDQAKVEMSNPFPVRSLDLFPDIVGYDDDQYYVYQGSGSAYVNFILSVKVNKDRSWIATYDHDLNPLEKVEIKLGRGSEKEQPALLMMNPDKELIIVSVLHNRKTRSQEVYTRKVDRQSLQIPEAGTKLLEVSYDQFPKDKDIRFQFMRSRDSSKFMIFHELPGKKTDDQRFKVYTYSQDMSPLWNQEFTISADRELFSIYDLEIDNQANVYLLGKEYFETIQNERNGLPNYRFRFFQLVPGFEVPDEFEINTKGKFMVNVHMDAWSDQSLVIAGFYAEEGDGRVKGVYFLTIDGTTKQIKTESQKELSLSMMEGDGDYDRWLEEAEAKSEKKKKKEEKQQERQVAEYKFKDLILRSDGGAALVCEKSYEFANSSYNSQTNTWRYYTTYIRNNIVVIHISPNGEVEHINIIPKRQRMDNTDMFLSYTIAVKGSKIYFIINDDIDNLYLEANQVPDRYTPSYFNKKKQIVELISLDAADYAIKRQSLITAKKAGMFAIPISGKQVHKQETILVFQKGKTRSLARIIYP